MKTNEKYTVKKIYTSIMSMIDENGNVEEYYSTGGFAIMNDEHVFQSLDGLGRLTPNVFDRKYAAREVADIMNKNN